MVGETEPEVSTFFYVRFSRRVLVERDTRVRSRFARLRCLRGDQSLEAMTDFARTSVWTYATGT